MDYDGAAASSPITNKYSLIVTQQVNPTISFDKNSSFVAFANDAGIDTDFSFKSVNGDTLHLLGNRYGSALTLIKASAQESTDYLAGKMIQSINAINTLNSFKLYFKRFTANNKIYDLIISPQLNIITFNYTVNGVFQRFHSYYAHTTNGILFRTPFVDENLSITELNNFQINTTANTATVMAGTISASIASSATPLILDLQAAQKFYNEPYGGYWASDYGFTINGIENAFNLTSIPGYSGITYNPKYGSGFDALLFYYNANRIYGPAILTRTESNGKIVFHSYAGNFSNPAGSNPGAPHTTTIASFRNQWLDPMGYFVIQTSPISFDLVGARNGNIWISFK